MDTLPSLSASEEKLRDQLPRTSPTRRPEGADLWRALRKHWISAIAVASTVFVGVAFITLTKTPKYQSETLVLVDNQTSVPVLPNSQADGASYYGNYQDQDLATEVQILRSGPLVARALEQLQSPYQDLSISQVVGSLDIQRAGEADVLIVSYTDTNPERAKAVLEALGTTYVNYSLERKRSQATNAIRFIEAKLPEARQTLNKSALEVRAFRQRYGIVDPDPYAEAVSMAKQTLQEEAKKAEISLNQIKTEEQVLRRQMAKVGQDPKTALADSVLSQDSTYQELVSRLRGIEIDYAQQSIHYQDNHPTLQDLRTARSKTLSLLQAQARRILGPAVSQADLSRARTSTPAGVSSQTAPIGANSQASQPSTPSRADSGVAQSTNQGTNPSGGQSAASTSRATGSDLRSIQQDLAGRLLQVQTDLAVQATQLQSTRQAQAEVDKRFQQIPKLQQSYTELQRQFILNSKAVDQFLEKLQELRVTEAQETSPWRVLEPPYLPQNPISPNIQRSLLLGLISGGLLGVAVAVLLNRLDARLKDVEEAKELTGLPLLGAIPSIDMQVLAADRERHSLFQRRDLLPFTEALRSLALNLRYLGSSGHAKTFAFTSAFPTEGKTTVTYYLGLVLAELGRRVLIVDADMRKPAIHKLLRVPNAFGLSTAIATDSPWQELIHPGEAETLDLSLRDIKDETPADSSSQSDLLAQRYQATIRRPDVITTGPIPPNPSTLLGSEKMAALLSEWRQVYDYVLIDTPPIVGITDAQSIASQIDGMVLVTAMERSTRSAIARALEILEGSQCKIAGLVVNLLDKEHGGYHYYQYYASYYNGQPHQGNGSQTNGHKVGSHS